MPKPVGLPLPPAPPGFDSGSTSNIDGEMMDEATPVTAPAFGFKKSGWSTVSSVSNPHQPVASAPPPPPQPNLPPPPPPPTTPSSTQPASSSRSMRDAPSFRTGGWATLDAGGRVTPPPTLRSSAPVPPDQPLQDGWSIVPPPPRQGGQRDDNNRLASSSEGAQSHTPSQAGPSPVAPASSWQQFKKTGPRRK